MSGSATPSRTRPANPEALGLFAFFIAQAMIGASHAELVPAAVATFFIPAVAITGGFMQWLSSVVSFARGETFGATVFGMYGSFFLGLGFFLVMQKAGLLTFGKSTATATGAFLLPWAVFTVGIAILAFRQSRPLGVMFVFIALGFLGSVAHYLWGLDGTFGGWASLVSAGIGFGIAWRNSLASLVGDLAASATAVQSGDATSAGSTTGELALES